MGTSRCVTCINVIKYSKYTSTAWAVRSCQSHQSWSLIDFFIGSAICGGSISSKFTPPRNLPSGTWVHIFRVLVVRSLPIASVSSVYQGIDLQYKKHEYGQTLVEYAITWSSSLHSCRHAVRIFTTFCGEKADCYHQAPYTFTVSPHFVVRSEFQPAVPISFSVAHDMQFCISDFHHIFRNRSETVGPGFDTSTFFLFEIVLKTR